MPAHPQCDDAWAALYDQYRPRLVRAAQKHQALACTGTSAAQIADRAFTRMWEAIGSRPGKFSRFKDLGALINYLHACVHSVFFDACRHGRSHVAGQPKDRDRIPQPPGRLELDEFWVEIRKHAKRAG